MSYTISDYVSEAYQANCGYTSPYQDVNTPAEALFIYVQKLESERAYCQRTCSNDPKNDDYFLEFIEPAKAAQEIVNRKMKEAFEEMRQGSKELAELAGTLEDEDFDSLEF